MRETQFTAADLIKSLLNLSESEQVCLLDSGGVSNLGSHLLIAGIRPLEMLEIADDAQKTLDILDEKLTNPNFASIFTISYDFGLKLQNIKPRPKKFSTASEPDVFLARFDCLIIHDYDARRTFLTGDEKRFDEMENLLKENVETKNFDADFQNETVSVFSNFTRRSYIAAVKQIQEFIRRGDTYQTNLTQQLRARLPENISPQQIFYNLRKSHPAPFSAFLKRANDFVISASPERFVEFQVSDSGFRVSGFRFQVSGSKFQISASPIKGTRPRGKTAAEDSSLKNELLNSEKDRAENVMIVDLLRNDLGRVCKFGSVAVEKLCDLETHPTLFHLVSTVTGELRENAKISDVLKAVFPCGSITGAPKVRTMQIIDELETVNRGLSMGAIGYSIPKSKFQISDSPRANSEVWSLDLSVAIRTMVIKNREAVFNVGGGIVIDGTPESEYEETLVKAKALLDAFNGKLN